MSSDFRSNDKIQKRIIDEFQAYLGEKLIYTGGRRGGASDVIQRRPNLLSSDTVAQSLSAFHGRPDVGYKFKSRIWEDNEDYKRVFHDKTSAKHILFVYSLFNEILSKKNDLKSRIKDGEELRKIEQDQLEFFDTRGSVFVLVYAISESMEIFLDRKIDDKFDLHFKNISTVNEYQKYWYPIINTVLAFPMQLKKALDKNYSLSMDGVEVAVDDVVGLVTAVAEHSRDQFDEFSEKVN
jgi:hypothetical protein